MDILKTILLIILVSLFQVTIVPKMTLFSALPNFILIFSLFSLFQNGLKKALYWSIFGGLFLDFFGLTLASNIFALTIVVLLTWYLSQKFFETKNFFLFLIFPFFASLIFDFNLILLSYIPYFSPFKFPFPGQIILKNALYNTFCFSLIYLLFKKKRLVLR